MHVAGQSVFRDIHSEARVRACIHNMRILQHCIVFEHVLHRPSIRATLIAMVCHASYLWQAALLAQFCTVDHSFHVYVSTHVCASCIMCMCMFMCACIYAQTCRGPLRNIQRVFVCAHCAEPQRCLHGCMHHDKQICICTPCTPSAAIPRTPRSCRLSDWTLTMRVVTAVRASERGGLLFEKQSQRVGDGQRGPVPGSFGVPFAVRTVG